MIFESENGVHLADVNKRDIVNELVTLNGTSNSYAVLEKADGSYMQVGGGPLQFTVEVRKYLSNGDFIHKKAGKPDSKKLGKMKLIISGTVVDVQSYQVLDIEMVVQLFSSFLNGEYFSIAVAWEDITNIF